MATVHLRRKADLYDEDNAVQVEVMQHVFMERRFGEGFQHSVPLKTAQNAREPLLARAVRDGSAPPSVLPRPVCPSSQEFRLSASGDSRPPLGDFPSPGSGLDCDVSESDTFEVDMEAQALLFKDIFGLAHDPIAERLPMIDLWLELRPSHGRRHSQPAQARVLPRSRRYLRRERCPF